MILKKPYAFLVKNFRLIHILLMLCSTYLMVKTWNIVGFFGGYIRNNQVVTSTDLSSTYITSLMNIIPIVIIIICGIVIFLLHYKDKPVMLYVYIGLLYFLIFLMYRYLDSFFYGLNFDKPGIRFVNILRDVYRVLTVIQLPVIGLSFIRALGFDFRKFDFKKDLLDLGIEDVDNEEYELEFKIDKEDVVSTLKKKLRLFKYFYKENRLLFTGIEILVGAIVIVFVFNFIKSREIIYKQSKNIKMEEYNVKILESYKLKTDNRGNKLKSGSFYVILKLRYENKKDYEISPGMMYLSYDDGLSKPTTEMNQKLNEFGVNYYNQTIEPHETRDFVFIFEVPIEYYNSKLVLRHLKKISYEENRLNYEYYKVKVEPKTFKSKKEKMTTKNIGEEITLAGSLYGNTKIKVDEVKIKDIFYYNIIKCSTSGCISKLNSITASTTESFSLTVMRLKLNVKFDYETLGKNYNNSKVISDFGSVRFVINGKEYNNRLKLKDITPFVTNEYVYVQVREKVNLAEKIYLDLNIRDKQYTYVIKDTSKEGA